MALEFRSNVVAWDASQPLSVSRACQNSCSLPFTGSTRIKWRSPVPTRWNCSRVTPGLGSAPLSSLCASGQFSIGAFSGIGKGPGSDSSGYSVIRTGTRGWCGGTITKFMSRL